MKAEAAAPARQGTPFLVLQFFVFPLGIVAVCVAVFLVFGLIASEGKGAREYLAEVRTGGANRRWQAAFELSKVLQAGKDPALRDEAFVQELIRTFQEADRDDPRVRRYLALALGRLGDRRAVPSLRAAAAAPADGSSTDPETRVYAVWALGAIADEAALPELRAIAADPDAGLRKAAVHAMGAFPDAATREALARALEDPVEDVRWNAALGLARHGDRRAAPTLARMLDRSQLAGVPGLTPEQQDEALLEAVKGAARLADAELAPALTRLREGDPSPKVREAARVALETRPRS
jgi:HEAT repeat protein